MIIFAYVRIFKETLILSGDTRSALGWLSGYLSKGMGTPRKFPYKIMCQPFKIIFTVITRIFRTEEHLFNNTFGLDDQGGREFESRSSKQFSLLHIVQTGSGVHPTSYNMGHTCWTITCTAVDGIILRHFVPFEKCSLR
jgi:hypothetical protein